MPAMTEHNNRYSQIQVENIIYLNNYYDYLLDFQTSKSAFIQWSIPCGKNIGWASWEAPETLSINDQCKLSYHIPLTGGDNDAYKRVRAYPSALVGSWGGRDSSWGIGDKTGFHGTGVLAESGRCFSKVYDMRDVNNAIGLPCKVDDLHNSRIQFNYTPLFSGTSYSVDNLFIDTYIHDISKPQNWPDGYKEEWGDLNKINSNKTSAWNINIWIQRGRHPDGDATTLWTGGKVLADGITLPSGQKISINCKHERNYKTYDEDCQGGFFYVGVILKSDKEFDFENSGEEIYFDINYQEIFDFVVSDSFKSLVMNSPDCVKIWEDLGRPNFVSDSPEDFIIDGIGLGKEVWFSKTDGLTCDMFNDLKFTVNDKEFGKLKKENIINSSFSEIKKDFVKNIFYNNVSLFEISYRSSSKKTLSLIPENDNLEISIQERTVKKTLGATGNLHKVREIWSVSVNEEISFDEDVKIFIADPSQDSMEMLIDEFTITIVGKYGQRPELVNESNISLSVGDNFVIDQNGYSDVNIIHSDKNIIDVSKNSQGDVSVVGISKGVDSFAIKEQEIKTTVVTAFVENNSSLLFLQENDVSTYIMGKKVNRENPVVISCNEVLFFKLRFINPPMQTLSFYLDTRDKADIKAEFISAEAVPESNLGEVEWTWKVVSQNSGCAVDTTMFIAFNENDGQNNFGHIDIASISLLPCPDCEEEQEDCLSCKAEIVDNMLEIYNPNNKKIRVSSRASESPNTVIHGFPATILPKSSQRFRYESSDGKFCISSDCL